MDLLLFELGRQRVGLRLADVREVARAVLIASLPGAPEIVEGVVDVRGRLVPVLDVRARFGLPPKPLELTDHLVILQAGERLVALRVDGALDLGTVGDADWHELTSEVPCGRWLAGAARTPAGLVVIYDLSSFLTDAEAAALDRALSEDDGAALGLEAAPANDGRGEAAAEAKAAEADAEART